MPKKSPLTTINAIPPLRFRFIAGGAAGNLTVTGIKPSDQLAYVGGTTLVNGTPNTFSVINDRTSEFTITADNTINNTGGTATTGALLLIVWYSTDPKLG